MSVNPDISETQKMLGLAQELVEWVSFEDGSNAHFSDYVRSVRSSIVDAFYQVPASLAERTCPLFVSYLIHDCGMNVFAAKWDDIALALSNISGERAPWETYRAGHDA